MRPPRLKEFARVDRAGCGRSDGDLHLQGFSVPEIVEETGWVVGAVQDTIPTAVRQAGNGASPGMASTAERIIGGCPGTATNGLIQSSPDPLRMYFM